MTKYICSKCEKEFKDSSGLSKHLLLKKVNCDGVIDTEYWLLKQIKKLHERYNELKIISELPDETLDFEEKKKILKAFYLKACNIKKLISESREHCPNISEEEVNKINKYIEACKTGEYT